MGIRKNAPFYRVDLGEKGALLVFFFVILALLMVLPTIYKVTVMSKKTTKNTILKSQTAEIARSGILDALNWFRRQTIQPVASDNPTPGRYPYPDAAFNPLEDSSTAQGGTLDASIGLVKEYEVSPEKRLWARHELRRQGNPAATPIDPHAVHDITSLRFPGVPAGQGLAWSLMSRGVLFERNSPNPHIPYNQPPNRVIDFTYATAEIQRLTIPPLLRSALLIPAVQDSDRLTLLPFTTIDGGVFPGIVTFNDAGYDNRGANVTGSVALNVVPEVPLTAQTFFGVSLADLYMMSDQAYDASVQFKNHISLQVKDKMVYVRSMGASPVEISLNPEGMPPPYGDPSGGILFIEGSAILAGNFYGLVFVQGNAQLRQANIKGRLVVTGALKCLPHPVNGQPLVNVITYDAETLGRAYRFNSNYREVRRSLIAGGGQ